MAEIFTYCDLEDQRATDQVWLTSSKSLSFDKSPGSLQISKSWGENQTILTKFLDLPTFQIEKSSHLYRETECISIMGGFRLVKSLLLTILAPHKHWLSQEPFVKLPKMLNV